MGNRLRELRLEKKLSVLALSEKTGMHRNTISKIEAGTAELPEKYIKVLCDLFHVTSDYLLGMSDVRYTEKAKFDNLPLYVKVYTELKDVDDELAEDIMFVLSKIKGMSKKER